MHLLENNVDRHLPANAVVGVFHAHPDDRDVTMAELTYSAVHSGRKTHIIDATNGEAGEGADEPSQQAIRNGYRQQESQSSARLLGVPPERQHFLNLPDGHLNADPYHGRLHLALAQLIVRYSITDLFAPGTDGFDGHPDHIAAAQAAEAAATLLPSLLGQRLTLWQLDRTGQGTFSLPVYTARKLAAIAVHEMQFSMTLRADDVRTPHFGRSMPLKTANRLAPYADLLHTETFRRFTPQASDEHSINPLTHSILTTVA